MAHPTLMRFAIVALICAFGLAASPVTQPTLDQQCQAVADTWKDRFVKEHLSVVVSPPFIIAGDGGADRVNRYLNGTILAATDAMHKKLFDRGRPDQPIVILLFESDEPYRRLAKQWFGDEDISRFGYFRRDNVMVMNVGTGTGTLVHELTHAMIRPDFPQVPSWFNEGLASLFEQCTLDHGDIRGLPNWRLPDLQNAIRQKELRSLEGMITDNDFYGHALSGHQLRTGPLSIDVSSGHGSSGAVLQTLPPDPCRRSKRPETAKAKSLHPNRWKISNPIGGNGC